MFLSAFTFGFLRSSLLHTALYYCFPSILFIILFAHLALFCFARYLAPMMKFLSFRVPFVGHEESFGSEERELLLGHEMPFQEILLYFMSLGTLEHG